MYRLSYRQTSFKNWFCKSMPTTHVIYVDNVSTLYTMKHMDTKVNFRTNKKTLARADKIFRRMGMDRSTALNIFLMEVVRVNGFPFKLTAKEYRDSSK